MGSVLESRLIPTAGRGAADVGTRKLLTILCGVESSAVLASRGGYGEKEGPKYGGPISFIMIDVRDAVYCTCTDPGAWGLEKWVQPSEASLGPLTLPQVD